MGVSSVLEHNGRLGERLDLLGFGEVMVLLQPEPPKTLSRSDSWRVHVAGAEFNACAAASALGLNVALYTRLGEDPPAKQIRMRSAELGVDLRVFIDDSAPTGLFLKDVLPDKERHVYYYRTGSAASRMDESDAFRGIGEQPRAVLLSGLTAALGPGPARMLIHAAKYAQESDTEVALDVNLRPGLGRLNESIRALEEILPITDLLVIGASDGAKLFGTSDPEDIARAARNTGVREVVVTAGPSGSWWQDDDGIMRHQKSLAREVVDTVGAGDAFMGGYLGGRLAGLSPMGASWLGSALAGRIVALAGDTAGLPSADESLLLLQEASELEEASA